MNSLFPVVLKADGRPPEKASSSRPILHDAEANVHATMVDKRFGQAGARLVIEEVLIGREHRFSRLRRHASCADRIRGRSQAGV
jgi:phosphoribosylamine-glycine ligase